jgi:excisionase family DNA binding protein
MQAVEIVRSRVTPRSGKSQRLAPILDDLLTTFLQGFMTVPQVAKRLGVCRSTVYQLCERGELPHVRVSNAIRVPVRAIAEFIGRNTDADAHPVAATVIRRRHPSPRAEDQGSP